MNIILKIRPISDLHTEFADFIVPPLPDDENTVLVLAGDIGIVHKASQLEGVLGPFLERCSQQFREVILVLGNHEHYHGSFIRTHIKLQEELDRRNLSNVHLLEKSSFVIDNTAFIGATLWTDCDQSSPHSTYMWSCMSDSKLIRTGYSENPNLRKFVATDTVQDHCRAKDYITNAVTEYQELGFTTVVVVHHGVTNRSIPEVFRGDSLNMFFVSEMTMDLMDMNPDLVIHGHLHNALDYMIDDTSQICKTRVVCNPRGYPTENTGFNELLTLEV